MARGKVTDKDRGYRLQVKRLLGLGNLGVSVGVHPDAGTYDDGTPVAEAAALNEFGSEGGLIPERSFLRSTLDENQSRYARALEKAVDRSLDGVPLNVALLPLGQQVVSDVQRKIESGVGPPNAPSTIAKKGHGDTLQDTGLLHDSIVARVGALK